MGIKPDDFGYVMQDLRATNNPQDHKLWMTLFDLAYTKVGRDLCDRLQYLRGAGCRLLPHSKYGYVIRPIIGAFAWESENQYRNEAKCLNPYKDKLIRLLKYMASGKVRHFR